jgi:hypothetical protein
VQDSGAERLFNDQNLCGGSRALLALTQLLYARFGTLPLLVQPICEGLALYGWQIASVTA